MHHTKIDVRDLAASLDFYCGTLAFREIIRFVRPDGVTIVQISPTGFPPGIEIWYEPPHQPTINDRFHIALGCKNVIEFVATLKERKVIIAREPFRLGDEIIAFIRDPDGHLIELNETRPRDEQESTSETFNLAKWQAQD